MISNFNHVQLTKNCPKHGVPRSTISRPCCPLPSTSCIFVTSPPRKGIGNNQRYSPPQQYRGGRRYTGISVLSLRHNFLAMRLNWFKAYSCNLFFFLPWPQRERNPRDLHGPSKLQLCGELVSDGNKEHASNPHLEPGSKSGDVPRITSLLYCSAVNIIWRFSTVVGKIYKYFLIRQLLLSDRYHCCR